MRVGFYAPLKSPDHPIPSGDRQIARLFLAALRLAGHEPSLISRFRSYDGSGDLSRQARLASVGERLAQSLVHSFLEAPQKSPELWFSYHVYHKAPDWLGPTIANALGIPYIVAEASLAPRQAFGPWALGHRAVERAVRRADAVIGLNRADRECVLPLLRHSTTWVAFKPFLDANSYGREVRPSSGPLRLIVVAMMRYGDKLASYQILGDALSRLLDLWWSLEVVGDGSARGDVERALSIAKERIIWAGSLADEAIAERLSAADICVWPAVNEALGMALLEAQASSLPVVAGASGGVAGIVENGATGFLVTPGDPAAFAAALRALMLDEKRRLAFGKAARKRVLREHDLSNAARRLATVIDRLTRWELPQSMLQLPL
ncbi:MAG: glycosyltransferase family 4 protein [Alphaproteobacteria bacterium]|nr:glycosyltransferase family 4 protein [Alphaproteobacteria bacterium]